MEDQMPKMPIEKNNDDVSANTSPSLSGEGVSSDTPNLEDSGPLAPPVHEEDEVIIDKPEDNIDSQVTIPVISKQGIKVRATRRGFYGQHRKKENDLFVVSEFEKLGDWMTCYEDKVMEKKRVEFFKMKKANR